MEGGKTCGLHVIVNLMSCGGGGVVSLLSIMTGSRVTVAHFKAKGVKEERRAACVNRLVNEQTADYDRV